MSDTLVVLDVERPILVDILSYVYDRANHMGVWKDVVKLEKNVLFMLCGNIWLNHRIKHRN